MKKFISHTVLFLLFATLFYSAFVFIWQEFAPPFLKVNIKHVLGSGGHTFSRLKEVKSEEQLDILFLGSSHTYRGFDNRIFTSAGYHSFNLGSSSQTPAQTRVLVNRYLDQVKPDIVIYEVYPITLFIDGIESSLDVISNDRNDWYSYQMTFGLNHPKTYNTIIYSSIRDLLRLNDGFEEELKRGMDTYIEGGFVEREVTYYSPESFEPKPIEFNPDQLNNFNEIVATIKQRDIKLILVYAPIPKVNYQSFTNTPQFDSLMATYADYHNFNELLDLNDSLHFYDSHHLNQKGVELFNRKLIEIIE